VRTGAFLSGGLDSAVVAALMRRIAGAPIPTFSVGMRGSATANELAPARETAHALGTEHHEVEVDLGDADLEALVWRLDEPVAELSALGLVELCRSAGGQVGVALSGQGADGILGGLPAHRTNKLAERWARVPRPVARVGEGILARGSPAMQRAARVFAADAADRYLLPGNGYSVLRERLVRGPLAAHDGGAARRAVLARLDGLRADPMATYIYVDEQLAAPDTVLHYNDRSATAGPLDVRFPFLDQALVEHCATIPTDLKVRRLTRKYLLREAVRDIVPEPVLRRQKVGFFNSAFGSALGTSLRRDVEVRLLDPAARCGEFLEPRVVSELAAGRVPGADGLLLAILVLEVWLSSVLPRGLAASPAGASRASGA
jgi:asparagine synthase (glutamine-hydrolysing)